MNIEYACYKKRIDYNSQHGATVKPMTEKAYYDESICCDWCKRIAKRSDMKAINYFSYGNEGEFVCKECAKEHARTCVRCGEVFNKEQYRGEGIDSFCSNCANHIEDEFFKHHENNKD